MITPLTVTLIDRTTAIDKIAIIREAVINNATSDVSMVSYSVYNDDPVRYFILSIGTFAGRVSYTGVFDSPSKFYKYIDKKVSQEKEKQRIEDEKNPGIQFNQPNYSEKMIEELLQTNSEKQLSSLFDNDFSKFSEFIRDNRVLYLVEEPVKVFLQDVLKEGGKSSFWSK